MLVIMSVILRPADDPLILLFAHNSVFRVECYISKDEKKMIEGAASFVRVFIMYVAHRSRL